MFISIVSVHHRWQTISELIVKGKYNLFVVKWPDLSKRIIYFTIENKICEAQTSNSDGIHLFNLKCVARCEEF